MELAEFVANTLIDVVQGVRRANKQIMAANEWSRAPFGLRAHGEGTAAGYVEFDVAVTVSSADSKGAGAGIQVAVFNASLSGKEQHGEERVSHIRFCVTQDLHVT